jgi:hypothetical protein
MDYLIISSFLRWFRLESGELRYYGEESMRPSKLKGTVILKGCTMPPGPENEGENISVLKPDGNCLLMIALTKESAREWRAALSETITILSRMNFDSGLTSGGKVRRVNITNVSEPDTAQSQRSTVR